MAGKQVNDRGLMMLNVAEHIHQARGAAGVLILVGGEHDAVNERLEEYADEYAQDVAILDMRGAEFADEIRLRYARRTTVHRADVYPMARAVNASVTIVQQPAAVAELVRLVRQQHAIDKYESGAQRLLVMAVSSLFVLRNLPFVYEDGVCIKHLAVQETTQV